MTAYGHMPDFSGSFLPLQIIKSFMLFPPCLRLEFSTPCAGRNDPYLQGSATPGIVVIPTLLLDHQTLYNVRVIEGGTAMNAMNAMKEYVICTGDNNPILPSVRPYAVIYKMSSLGRKRGMPGLQEKAEYYDGLALYLGEGRWIDFTEDDIGVNSQLLESESPEAEYEDWVIDGEEEAFIRGETDFCQEKYRRTVYAYAPLPDPPEDCYLSSYNSAYM
jgi:hypothetical protein